MAVKFKKKPCPKCGKLKDPRGLHWHAKKCTGKRKYQKRAKTVRHAGAEALEGPKYQGISDSVEVSWTTDDGKSNGVGKIRFCYSCGVRQPNIDS